MNLQHKILQERITQVFRRWRKLILIRGGAKVLLTLIGTLLLAFALDTFFVLNNSIRLAMLLVSAAVFLMLFYRELLRPLRRAPSANQIARYIEERHPELEDRLVSAVELGGADDPRISAQILNKLLEDTRFHIEPMNLPKEIHARTAIAWSSLALTVCVFLSALAISNLDFITLKSNRLFKPWSIPDIKLGKSLEVTPGNVRLPRGSAQEIKAEISGFDSEEMVLYYTTNDSLWNKIAMDRTKEPNTFVYNFFDLQQPTKYYVKAEEQLSEIYTVNLYDAPAIKRVDLYYRFPDYTGLRPKKEMDSGDIWAPEGSVVRITAITDKPLKEGLVLVGEGKKLPTTVRQDTVVTASLKVTHDTYYKILITDLDGLSNLPLEYFVHAMPDQPPTLSLQEPGRDLKVTMLEEVPIRVSIQDDYGLADLKLIYTVSGGEDQTVSLPIDKNLKSSKQVSFEEIQEFSAHYDFFLEDMQVQPGDFVTYYVQANDNNHAANMAPVTSEIFFLEIRPFEKDFLRPVSQGQMAGMSGPGGRLSQTQKDIMVATWKLFRKKDMLTPEKFQESVDVLVESQENLQEVTQNTLYQIQQRSFFSRNNEGNITEFYSDAVEAMGRAVVALQAKRLKEAQTPERESLQSLLRAEAQMTELQLQQAQAQGASNRATLDELAQLFEDEMDKLKNKYESARDNLQKQADQQVDEALEKVKELARRQQQVNQKLRNLAKKKLPPAEKRRQIQELRRLQEEMRRETQQLARKMQQSGQQNRSLSRDIQENLRRSSSEMNNSSKNLRQQNTDLAAAKGQQALNRLKQLEKLLEKNQKESLRRQFDSIDKQFQRLANSQKKLTKDVEEMTKNQQGTEKEKSQAQQAQLKVKQDYAALKEKIKNLSDSAGKSKNEATRHLHKFSQELENAKIERKMDSAEDMLAKNRLNSALQAERDIKNMLERMQDKFTRMQSRFADSEEEKLDLALNQTRKLREKLEAIQRQAQELNRAASEENQNSGQNRENAQARRAGPGENRKPDQDLDPRKLDWLNEELARGLQELEFIENSTQVDTSLARQANRINQNMQRILRTFTGGDENRLKLIEAQVLIPLKGFESELAQKVELMQNREKLFLAKDEKIPPEYVELVQKYYEALSKTK
ncbi:MAG: DUF4175 family protein [bacterium]